MFGKIKSLKDVYKQDELTVDFSYKMKNSVNQIRNFLESDYEGFFSFEPFAKDLSGNKNLLDIIRKNFKYIEDNLKK